MTTEFDMQHHYFDTKMLSDYEEKKRKMMNKLMGC